MRILVCGGRSFANLPKTKPPHILKNGAGCAVDWDHPDFPAKKAEHDIVISKLYELAEKYSRCKADADEYGNWLPTDIEIVSGMIGMSFLRLGKNMVKPLARSEIRECWMKASLIWWWYFPVGLELLTW